MQWGLLAEAVARQDHSSLQTRAVGLQGLPASPFTQTAGRKSLIGRSLCPGSIPLCIQGWLTCGVVERLFQINSETLVASMCLSWVPQTAPAFPNEHSVHPALHRWLQPTLLMFWGGMANLQPVVWGTNESCSPCHILLSRLWVTVPRIFLQPVSIMPL